MKKCFLIAVVFFAVFISCKKSSNTSNNNNNTNGDSCSITKGHLQGSYRITDAYANAPSYSYSADIYTSTDPIATQFFPQCRKDDIITLDSTGICTYTDAGDTCKPKGGSTGTWDLKGDTLIGTLGIAGSGKDSLVINSYDCKTAVVTYSISLGTVKLTLSKQ